MLPVPGDAEQVVQRSTELLHAGLIWTQRDVEDQTTAPVLPPWKVTNEKISDHFANVCYRPPGRMLRWDSTWEEGQFLLEHREDGARFHVDVGHLQMEKDTWVFFSNCLFKMFGFCLFCKDLKSFPGACYLRRSNLLTQELKEPQKVVREPSICLEETKRNHEQGRQTSQKLLQFLVKLNFIF